ncbi:MAG: 3-dehydroquinate synthase [Sulfurospirillum sp.]|nr:MAG: 3-dehydroquinate synthase [Sulfurospirillum sp.]
MQTHIHFENRKSVDYTIYIDEMEKMHFDTKVAIVTNPKVAGLHLSKLLEKISAKELYIITVKDGENYKNQESLDYILENLFNHRFDRNSLLIAFGGGVVGDMTGFAASVFQRGIDFIQIPTTLLSQVDASVGGKTGINNRFGKNLIGAFYQPKAVYIETEFLKTLPEREFGAGVAEIVKMAVTFDADFFQFLEYADLHQQSDLAAAIRKSVETKAKVVGEDEKEKGIRAVLNYGHTFAHVIENITGYSRYLHGEAVAIGMVMANRLAQRLGFLDDEEALRIQKVLERYHLPVSFKIEDPERFYDAFFLDKKSENETIKFILPYHIGGYEMVRGVDRALVLSVLREFDSED